MMVLLTANLYGVASSPAVAATRLSIILPFGGHVRRVRGRAGGGSRTMMSLFHSLVSACLYSVTPARAASHAWRSSVVAGGRGVGRLLWTRSARAGRRRGELRGASVANAADASGNALGLIGTWWRCARGYWLGVRRLSGSVGRRRFCDARRSRFRRGVIPGNGGAEERFRHANEKGYVSRIGNSLGNEGVSQMVKG